MDGTAGPVPRCAMRLTMADLDSMPEAELKDVLGDLFEHSPWLAEAVATGRPFVTARALHDAMMARLRGATPNEQLGLIRAHPELAGQEAAGGVLTEDSTSEQSRLGYTRLSRAEHDALAGLNARYRNRFGFPCIVALCRHDTRDSVADAIRRRLEADPDAERAVAIDEIGHITAARLAGRLGRAHGALSIHALDTTIGGGAAGLAFELYRDEAGHWRQLAARRTDAQGRTDGPLLAGLDMEPGGYRIDYHLGDYHRARGVSGGFLDVVPIAFRITEPDSHYHVPLQFTPWSYATYRGS